MKNVIFQGPQDSSAVNCWERQPNTVVKSEIICVSRLKYPNSRRRQIYCFKINKLLKKKKRICQRKLCKCLGLQIILIENSASNLINSSFSMFNWNNVVDIILAALPFIPLDFL